jgi:hypothetical protein
MSVHIKLHTGERTNVCEIFARDSHFILEVFTRIKGLFIVHCVPRITREEI